MKKLLFALPLLFATFGFNSLPQTVSSGLNIGDKALLTDRKMTDVSGKQFNLNDLKGKNGLLVVFSCNTCPFVLAWENRYNEIYDHAKKNNIGMVLINSNEAKRGNDDSLDEMKAHAKKLSYKMPYVIDENHEMADAFGAKTTPHVFLFDKNLSLQYTGAIDDNKDKSQVKTYYLKEALSELGQGKSGCNTPQTKAVGCSIKRIVQK